MNVKGITGFRCPFIGQRMFFYHEDMAVLQLLSQCFIFTFIFIYTDKESERQTCPSMLRRNKLISCKFSHVCTHVYGDDLCNFSKVISFSVAELCRPKPATRTQGYLPSNSSALFCCCCFVLTRISGRIDREWPFILAFMQCLSRFALKFRGFIIALFLSAVSRKREIVDNRKFSFFIVHLLFLTFRCSPACC